MADLDVAGHRLSDLTPIADKPLMRLRISSTRVNDLSVATRKPATHAVRFV